MPVVTEGPEIDKSALIIVDMQNDFLHEDGNFSHIAREHPELRIDMPFLIGTIPNVKRLAEAFRKAGRVSCARTEARLFGRGLPLLAYWNRACERQPHALCRGHLGSPDRR